MKYFESFKNDQPFVVVTADRDALRKAHEYFLNSDGAYLDDAAITEFSDVAPLMKDNLFLSRQECLAIAEHFRNLYALNEPRHAYFDTVALGNEIEIIISFNEYDSLF